MKKFLQISFIVLASFIIGAIVRTTFAGSLTPPSTLADTMYSLEDIYNLANGTPTTEHSGALPSTPGSTSGTGKTLTEVYDAVESALGGGASLANMFNGTCDNPSTCPLGTEFNGGSQANGGVDDLNAGDAPATGRFETTWTTCNVGNSYCGTGDAGANTKDTATGIVWSYPCTGSGCASFDTSVPDTTPGCFYASNCGYSDTTYSWDNSGVNNNSLTAQELCSSHTGWSLPHQKQLMQAYIDGSYGNLDPQEVLRFYWSATTLSNGASGAWYVGLSYGSMSGADKNYTAVVRCIQE